jgi:two-component system, LytTR family, response regulator LytT
MRILIVEDEEPAQKRLKKIILEVIPQAELLECISSIESAIRWFRLNPMPELIFMDIQLEDGNSFEIFREVKITSPIIFITAFDQYAIDAFKVNSIDYLLKPVNKEDLLHAYNKLMHLKKSLSPAPDYLEKLHALDTQVKSYKKRFAIRFGEHIKSVATEDISYFYTENKINFLCTSDNRKYPVDFNLDQLETLLDPEQFFRINRQFIIGIHAIAEMRAYSKARVNIKLNPPCPQETIVSVERSAAFKQWLGAGKEE